MDKHNYKKFHKLIFIEQDGNFSRVIVW